MLETLALVAAMLILDAFLMAATWLFIVLIWNNVVREGLKVRSNLAWAYLVFTIALIANAVIIAHLMQR